MFARFISMSINNIKLSTFNGLFCLKNSKKDIYKDSDNDMNNNNWLLIVSQPKRTVLQIKAFIAAGKSRLPKYQAPSIFIYSLPFFLTLIKSLVSLVCMLSLCFWALNDVTRSSRDELSTGSNNHLSVFLSFCLSVWAVLGCGLRWSYEDGLRAS